jgi:iron complex outermembrane receptor protein
MNVLTGAVVLGLFFTVPESVKAQNGTEPPDSSAVSSLEALLQIPISSAAKREQTMREAPASAAVITSEDIERYGYRMLADALTQLRGFYGTYDREYSYLGTRGFGRPSDYNTRIQVQVDGHVLNEAFYSSALLGTGFGVPMEAIDRIEVIRGPGSALHGGNALFAVVNIVTKKGRDADGVTAGFEVGSHGYRRSTVTIGGDLAGGMDGFFSASWHEREGEDLFFPEFQGVGESEGIAEGMDWDRSLGAQGSLRYGIFTLSFFGTSRNKGVPTAPWGSIFNDTPARRRDDRFFADLRAERKWGPDRRFQLRGYVDTYRSKRAHSFPMPWLLTRFTSEAHWAGLEGQYQHYLGPAHRLILGAEFRRHSDVGFRVFSFGEVRLEESYPFSLASVFTQYEWQVADWIALTGGLRADHYTNFGTTLSPRMAAVTHLGEETTVKVLSGRAFRPPNLWELNYQVPFVAKANPDLDPETIRTDEVVVEKRLSGWATGAVSVFRSGIRGLITSVLDPSDGLTQFRNLEDIEVVGVEWEVQARWSSGSHAYGSLSFQRLEDRTSGEVLPNAPGHQARAGLSHPVLPWLTASGSLRYDGERKTVRGGKTKGYLLANAHFLVRLLDDRVRVGIGMENLFDEVYRMPVSLKHAQEALQQDGRTLVLSVEARF